MNLTQYQKLEQDSTLIFQAYSDAKRAHDEVVAIIRQRVAELEARLQKEFEPVFAGYAQALEAYECQEAALRNAALELYREVPDIGKTPSTGVVQITVSRNVTLQSEALTWCKVNARLFVIETVSPALVSAVKSESLTVPPEVATVEIELKTRFAPGKICPELASKK